MGVVFGALGVTACPPGPGATQRSSTAGVASDQDELHQSESHGEDVTQSPPVPGQRGQSEDETEVVIRSQWRASAEEPGEGVTQLASLTANRCRSFGELRMLAASGQRQASQIQWSNLTTAVPLQYYECFLHITSLNSKQITFRTVQR